MPSLKAFALELGTISLVAFRSSPTTLENFFGMTLSELILELELLLLVLIVNGERNNFFFS